jgi:hypothetical protein
MALKQMTMNKLLITLLLLVAAMGIPHKTSAQEEEIQQLLLNVAKLAQFKQILEDLKKGYEIVHTGYTTIKDLSEGNFNLHKAFLDALWQVSPTVRNYKRIADIIEYQLTLVKEYKQAYNRFRQDDNFTLQEIEYLSRVYNNLFKQSLRSLDELTTIITANKLRMNDDERLGAIDRIFSQMQDKLMFLRYFNNNTTVLAVQRAKERNDLITLRSLYGISN